MGIASLIISLCIHIAIFLLIWFWPAPAALDLSKQPILISLVDGAAGGNRTPSPILGHMGEQSDGPLEPAPPAPQSEIAAPAREEIKTPEPKPLLSPEKQPPRETAPAPVPEPLPETPKAEPVPVVPRKEEIPKQPEKPKQEKPVEKPKPVEKKPEPQKPEPKKPTPAKPASKKTAPKQDPVAAALQKARQASSRVSSGDRGNAVEQALAQARKNAGGTRGGGGGEGSGPGGGGLGDVYIGEIMRAVRPNWGFASPGRKALSCVVKVNVDMQGKVLEARVITSSGNPQFDASAVNAVIRTSQAGDFPPPPNPSYTDLDLHFTLDEMAGR